MVPRKSNQISLQRDKIRLCLQSAEIPCIVKLRLVLKVNKALCAIQAQKIHTLSRETYSCVKSQKKGKFQIDQEGEHTETQKII